MNMFSSLLPVHIKGYCIYWYSFNDFIALAVHWAVLFLATFAMQIFDFMNCGILMDFAS